MLLETSQETDNELASLARFFGAGFTSTEGLTHCVKLARAIKQIVEAEHTLMLVPEAATPQVESLGGREFDVWHNGESKSAEHQLLSCG